jgi:hypothetical protein
MSQSTPRPDPGRPFFLGAAAGVLVLSAMLGLAGCGSGRDATEPPGEAPDPAGRDIETPALPAPPRPERLVALPEWAVVGTHRYYLDPDSIERVAEVVRYTIVVESASGAVNIFNEGIICSEGGEGRRYGFGSRAGELRPVVAGSWERVSGRGPLAYRRVLTDRYLCDDLGWPLSVEQVRARIRGLASAWPQDLSPPRGN